jgi:hypothetical protein
MIGAPGAIQPGPPLVVLLLNVEVIRRHPVGARMGPLVNGIPQWDEAMKGTTVDPLRDADWVLITGPSLIHTERDAVLVRYNASDAVADSAVEAIKRRSHNGAGFDAGVPGVRATLGHADRAPRVFMRPQTHLLVVVPPDYANTAAKMLLKAKVAPHVRPGEAMRLTLQTPHRPFPAIPDKIKEANLWIIPHDADGSADVFIEGRCDDPQAANDASGELKSFLGRFRNSAEGFAANLVTHGLIGGLEVSADGSLVRGHVQASRDQLEAILAFVALQLNVALPPPPGAAASASATPVSVPSPR